MLSSPKIGQRVQVMGASMHRNRHYPRNQSAEHAGLASRSLRWRSVRATRRGIVGATEIAVVRGYVADVVAIAGFQYRFLCRYCGGIDAGDDAVNEFVCIFEVKVSRGDFASTFGPSAKHRNRHRAVGRMHWCVTPRGLVKPDELPDWWGLLEKSGCGLREVKTPRMFPFDRADVNAVAYQILMYGSRRQVSHGLGDERPRADGDGADAE